MIVELANCTNVLLSEVAMPQAKRNDIALTYAMALSSSESTDWGKVNEAILNRWSFSGLEYIKNRAWKMQKGGGQPMTNHPKFTESHDSAGYEGARGIR